LLYHAFATTRNFILYKAHNKKFSKSEEASLAVLAVMCVTNNNLEKIKNLGSDDKRTPFLTSAQFCEVLLRIICQTLSLSLSAINEVKHSSFL